MASPAFNLEATGERLKQRYGEEGAFFLIDRLRTQGLGGLSPEERVAVADIPPERLSEVDRYLEGGMGGAPFAIMAAPYEALKPAIGAVAPKGSGFESGPATSPSSLGNVSAAFKGAVAGGRLLPKSITAPLASFVAGLLGREDQRPMGGSTALAPSLTSRDVDEIRKTRAAASPGAAMMRGLGFR